jgi:GTPase SAR1 family protein
MIQNSRTSITDLPRITGESDQFKIARYENGLIRFIESTATPITIALQGEWGSGKTSLMNSLKDRLSDTEGSEFYSIWLNTWEFALMKDAQSTLIDIITGLIKETSRVAHIEESESKKIINKLLRVGKTVMKVAADNIASGSSAVIDELTSNNGNTTIREIRNDLENIIETCVKKDNKKGFIFFIDDLDRIDPPVAVELLELLKNIFTLKNCIFILAIDYDVVIKGLEPKFGKLTDSNEREFRSFFDKIIQVPFSMPVNSYDINDFLRDSLIAINYISEEEAKNKDLVVLLSEISGLSVGKNPRALKRMLNSLSLIGCINKSKDGKENSEQLNDELELVVNFALVSVQVAYPFVYKILTLFPGFDKWDNNIALQLNLKELDERSIQKLNESEEFDEDWEKILFRLCENDYYLKKKALNISRLLNNLKEYITKQNETIEDVIEAAISLSSVTNIEAFDKPEVSYHKSNLLKDIRNHLYEPLIKQRPELKQHLRQQGKRIQINLVLLLSETGDQWVRLNSDSINGGIRLHIQVSNKMGVVKSDFKNDMKEAGLLEELEAVALGLKQLALEIPQFQIKDFFENIGIWKNIYFINFHAFYIQPNPKSFISNESIQLLCKLILGFYDLKKALIDIEKRLNQG